MPPASRFKMSLAKFAAARRGRNYATAKAQRASALATRRAGSMLVPGRTRTVGYYGRYNRPGARRSVNDAERKFLDNALNFTVDATAEVSAQLCGIAQGDTQSQRVGKKVVIKSIEGKMLMSYAPAAAANAAAVTSHYLVLDTQCNGAAATIADIWAGSSPLTFHRNMDNTQRFRILKVITNEWASPAGVTTAYESMVKYETFHLACDIPIIYDAVTDTGAITTIRSNNVFLVSVATTVADDLITITGNIRLRYDD